MSWTDDRVATLKKLWTEGLSASQIARELGGGVSRNAVIGKVHRLGLEGRQKTPSKPEDSAAVEATEDAAGMGASAGGDGAASVGATASVGGARADAAADQATGAASATNGTTDEDDADLAGDDAEADDDIVVPIPLKLKLVELTERTCKWPIGDPMHDDFHFCGHEADEGRPYCAYHSSLAFQPASERRRVR